MVIHPTDLDYGEGREFTEGLDRDDDLRTLSEIQDVVDDQQ